jgi:hypothetical protein
MEGVIKIIAAIIGIIGLIVLVVQWFEVIIGFILSGGWVWILVILGLVLLGVIISHV